MISNQQQRENSRKVSRCEKHQHTLIYLFGFGLNILDEVLLIRALTYSSPLQCPAARFSCPRRMESSGVYVLIIRFGVVYDLFRLLMEQSASPINGMPQCSDTDLT